MGREGLEERAWGYVSRKALRGLEAERGDKVGGLGETAGSSRKLRSDTTIVSCLMKISW